MVEKDNMLYKKHKAKERIKKEKQLLNDKIKIMKEK